MRKKIKELEEQIEALVKSRALMEMKPESEWTTEDYLNHANLLNEITDLTNEQSDYINKQAMRLSIAACIISACAIVIRIAAIIIEQIK